ncbi:hypothetical protein MMC25_007979 [Agyrium rufum]|nr:hypothetical protein [Agyrium rufum]
MGGLCSKSSRDDNFSSPGRTLNAAPAQNKTSSLPSKISGPGRILGDSSPSDTRSPNARRAAAEAAQERAAKANQPKGKLGQTLASQKSQTQNKTLGAASEEQRRLRDADENQTARNWN